MSNDSVNIRRAALASLLKDPAEAVRVAAAQAISQLEERSSLEETLQILKHGDLAAKVKAIFALGHVGGGKAVSALVYCAGRPEEDICSAAIGVLGELAPPQGLPVLLKCLDHPNTAIRARAIAAIASYPPSPEIRRRVLPFLAAGDGLLDAEAVGVLRKLKDRNLEPHFLALLSSPHARTREAAALALGDLPVT